MSSAATRSPFVESQLAAPASPLPGAGVPWLDAARREHLAAFAEAGLPTKHVEAWKYTALRALAQRKFSTGDAQAAARAIDASAFALPGVDGPVLAFVNGVFRADLSQLAQLPDGLELRPMSQALREDPEPLRFTLSRYEPEKGDVFVRLNAALAGDGVLLKVAAGAKVAAPVHLLFIGAPAEGDVAWHLRHVIELGEGSELSLVEHHAASGDQRHLGTTCTDIVLREGAVLHHAAFQDAAPGATLIRRTKLHLGARSHATVHVVELGAALARHDLQAELVGNEARFDTRGVFLLHAKQHGDTQLAIRQQALNTTTDSVWRGVADERARGVFRGAVLVEPGADGSDCNVQNKNLLLSEQAEIDTKPELVIYADEVKAVHGATVGQLDERALFYLQSRGIPQAQARGVLTAAFCRTVLDDLPNAELRAYLGDRLVAQLPA